jgi:hypothetical protein
MCGVLALKGLRSARINTGGTAYTIEHLLAGGCQVQTPPRYLRQAIVYQQLRFVREFELRTASGPRGLFKETPHDQSIK